MSERIKSWKEDLEDTLPAIDLIKSEIFKNKVDIQTVESKDEIILKWLDQYSGIDYIAKKKNQLITIACRIQWDINYKSFTIRFKRTTGTETEFSKRMEAIEKGYLYPTFTMQAYMKREPLTILDCAWIKTNILYGFIKENFNNSNLIFEKTTNKDGNKFKYIRWMDIMNLNSFWQYKSIATQLDLF